MVQHESSGSERRRRSAAVHALAALVASFVLSAAVVGCLIDERPFNPLLVNCKQYCDEIASKCVDANAVYEDDAQCMAVCAQMPTGSVDDPPGANSVLCRLEQLHSGSFEVGSGCPAAGPGGNGTCGANCTAFCALRQLACAAVEPTDSDISKPGFCEASCPGLADPAGYSVASFDNTDTLQCRLIQLSRALANPGEARGRCIESQIVPENQTSLCTDDAETPPETDCSTYCHLVMTSCRAERQVYQTERQCLETCPTFEPGVHGDTSTNTLRCRRYHAYAALDDPETHCAHAGPTGDGHCESPPQVGPGNCVSYCRILKTACPSEYALRQQPVDADDIGSCVVSCSGLDDARRDGFTVPPRYTTQEPPVGATLKCRTFHAVRALNTPDGEADCSAAFGDPGSPCE